MIYFWEANSKPVAEAEFTIRFNKAFDEGDGIKNLGYAEAFCHHTGNLGITAFTNINRPSEYEVIVRIELGEDYEWYIMKKYLDFYDFLAKYLPIIKTAKDLDANPFEALMAMIYYASQPNKEDIMSYHLGNKKEPFACSSINKYIDTAKMISEQLAFSNI
jgi:hypothetical protein